MKHWSREEKMKLRTLFSDRVDSISQLDFDKVASETLGRTMSSIQVMRSKLGCIFTSRHNHRKSHKIVAVKPGSIKDLLVRVPLVIVPRLLDEGFAISHKTKSGDLILR
jgi:hypothetical protein